MIVLILAGVFGGLKLDRIFNTLPLFTVVLSLAGVILALYFALKDFLNKK
jgi:F0F1-type ATP synthase assembly protein I